MTRNPIVVGVDASPEAAWAAALGAQLAAQAGTTCHLAHAARGVVAAPVLEGSERAREFRAAQIAQAREEVLHRLSGAVPTVLLEQVIVRPGRAAVVLKEIARDLGAELVVLGGKHHSVVGRWLPGSTGLDLARTTEVPLLVTGHRRSPLRQVLAAVDVSAAARPTIAAAERFARLLGAQLRVVSVLEPLPVVPGAPAYHPAEYYNVLEERVTQHVWPLVQARGAEKFVRYGAPVEMIAAETAAWGADLVVVGSHGKDWVDRLLLGSVTERLLNRLPTALLIVPSPALEHAADSPAVSTDRRAPQPVLV